MGGYRMGLVRFIEIFEGCKGFTRVSSGFYIYGVGAFYGVFFGMQRLLRCLGGIRRVSHRLYKLFQSNRIPQGP